MTLSGPVDGRLGVAKTYKLYLGGAFPRSESGRSYPVHDTKGRLLAHAALASRKDVRDAVSAASSAFGGWSGATAYNRGQVLYRVAEMMQARHREFVDTVKAVEAGTRKHATELVDAAIDRWVWYAGWTDKIAGVFGTVNPVAGPLLSWSTPEPTGVVGVLAPQSSALLGLVDALAPVLATGCTAVVVASEDRPLPAIGLAEVLATSDVPGGVANILTGRVGELAPLARRARRRACARPDRGPRRARRRPRARGGRHREAGVAAPGHRAGSDARTRRHPAPRLHRDQDGVAPGRKMTPRRP